MSLCDKALHQRLLFMSHQLQLKETKRSLELRAQVPLCTPNSPEMWHCVATISQTDLTLVNGVKAPKTGVYEEEATQWDDLLGWGSLGPRKVQVQARAALP